jgi:hypothetical protein
LSSTFQPKGTRGTFISLWLPNFNQKVPGEEEEEEGKRRRRRRGGGEEEEERKRRRRGGRGVGEEEEEKEEGRKRRRGRGGGEEEGRRRMWSYSTKKPVIFCSIGRSFFLKIFELLPYFKGN